jgi:hypothetical protein
MTVNLNQEWTDAVNFNALTLAHTRLAQNRSVG